MIHARLGLILIISFHFIHHYYSFSALKSSNLLEDMATRGIKYIDCYGVDNALV